MLLHEVPRNTKIRLCETAIVPPCTLARYCGVSSGDILFFHHVDGMYSLCETNTGEIVHLSAWQAVEIVP